MTNGRTLAWKALSLLLTVVVTLEAAYWIRPWAHLLRSTGGPFVEVTADGQPQLVVADWRHDERGNMEARRRIYDDAGESLRTETKAVSNDPRDWTPAATPFWGSHWQHPLAKLGHVLDMPDTRGDWADEIVKRLQGAQGQWNYRVVRGRTVGSGSIETRARFVWSFEDGRFVCRDAEHDDVVAGFGPDGASDGVAAATGDRFDRARVAPALALTNNGFGGQPMPFVLVDPERRAVHFVRLDLFEVDEKGTLRYRNDGDKVPVRVLVKSVAVAGPGGEPPAPLPSIAHGEWMQFYAMALSPKAGDRERIAVPVAAGPEIVEVREDGVVRRAPMDADESCAMSSGSDRFLWSLLPPFDGTVPRLRIRWWRDDGTLTRVDANVPPITVQAKCGLALAGLATLLRPPVANAASFAGPRVADWDDSFTRWFADPLVAGGYGGGWLAASLAVAAICAWTARRAAMLRRPDRVMAWTIAGAVLGVAGLVWMRVVVARSHVAVCACGRRRAVRVATCPSCAAAWPAPPRTGTEVFA